MSGFYAASGTARSLTRACPRRAIIMSAVECATEVDALAAVVAVLLRSGPEPLEHFGRRALRILTQT